MAREITEFPTAEFVVSGAIVFNGTAPKEWEALDLSSVVGINSALVTLSIHGDVDLDAVAVRKNGDTAEYHNVAVESSAYGCALGHHDSLADLVLMCATDSNGVMQWQTEKGSGTATVRVLSYNK